MKEVVIGFLGCGNVGGGVWNLLENFRKEIAHRNDASNWARLTIPAARASAASNANPCVSS